jgi:hypothetical protein
MDYSLLVGVHFRDTRDRLLTGGWLKQNSFLMIFYMVIVIMYMYLTKCIANYLKVHLIVTAAEDHHLTCLEEIRIQTGNTRHSIILDFNKRYRSKHLLDVIAFAWLHPLVHHALIYFANRSAWHSRPTFWHSHTYVKTSRPPFWHSLHVCWPNRL